MKDTNKLIGGLPLSEVKGIRWTALFLVAFTMLAAYYVNDVLAPLQGMLEGKLGWSSDDFGTYSGAYSFLNVFALCLIWGGLILDRFGIRLTGALSVFLMVGGTLAEYVAITYMQGSTGQIVGMRPDVFVAAAGYSVFGAGAEVAGITTTKIIAKWFAGKEMALAMGVQVAVARIGSQAAYAVALPVASTWNLDTPLLIGAILLLAGTATFLVFNMMDSRLDKQVQQSAETGQEEKFSFRDVRAVVSNPGFWLIALLCVLFYSCVFPFQKYATLMMITKYGVNENLAGAVAGFPALGALVLTPIFGGFIDKKGRAASIMIFGATLLILVHLLYAQPFLDAPWMAIVLMIILGIAFSLVPSAMWPSVAKIFPVKQLGTAYALIFFVQNIGLWGYPVLIGKVLEGNVLGSTIVGGEEASIYDYTATMFIFTATAVLSLLVAMLLKRADKKYGYGLEKSNLK